jgi:enoyl-CoA hydratase
MSDRYAHYERLKFDRPHPRVLRITMTSSLKLNAMDAVLHRETAEIWKDVDADKTVSAVIITGHGKAFSAGGDLNHERKVCDDYNLRMQAMKEARDLVYNMINCSKPIISAGRIFPLLRRTRCFPMDTSRSVSPRAITRLFSGHCSAAWPRQSTIC